MTDEHQPVDTELVETPKKQVRFRWADLAIFAVIIAICAFLSIFLYNRLVLKRDVADAKPVSDKALQALQDRNGSALWKLGDKKFQSTYTPSELTAAISKGAKLELKKSSLERQTAFTSKAGRTVYFLYKYNDLAVPYFVRIGVHHNGNTWQLVDMSSSTDPSKLLVQ